MAIDRETTKEEEELRETFLALTEHFLKQGCSLVDLRSTIGVTENRDSSSRKVGFKKNKVIFILIITTTFFLVPFISSIVLKKFYATRCLIQNNYFIWEFTRPVSDCDYCRRTQSPLILKNVTKETFKSYAYISKPIVVKGGASHWLASKVFDLQFFRNLYNSVEGAYDDEECQFLHFESNFATLQEVFDMTKEREMNLDGEEPWYVGWKNCHPQILLEMKKFYENPGFLPDEAEIPSTNYVFMGYGRGAVMHLDYIPRLMWQGQIIGSKTWYLAPTPECDHICQPFQFSVDTGDIVLLDTRIWYHGTRVDNGTFSVTITSEYG